MKSKKLDLLDFDELYFHTLSLDSSIDRIRYSDAKKGDFRIAEEVFKYLKEDEGDLIYRMIKEQYGSCDGDIPISWYARRKFQEERCFLYMWDECSFDFMNRWLPHRIQKMQDDGWEFFFFEK